MRSRVRAVGEAVDALDHAERARGRVQVDDAHRRAVDRHAAPAHGSGPVTVTQSTPMPSKRISATAPGSVGHGERSARRARVRSLCQARAGRKCDRHAALFDGARPSNGSTSGGAALPTRSTHGVGAWRVHDHLVVAAGHEGRDGGHHDRCGRCRRTARGTPAPDRHARVDGDPVTARAAQQHVRGARPCRTGSSNRTSTGPLNPAATTPPASAP